MVSVAGLVKRIGWNIADQGLSALANMALMVVVARAVDGAAFGAFAVGFLVYGIAVAVSKSITGQPLQIRHSNDSPEQFARAVGAGQGASFWFGLVSGLVCLAVGLLLGGDIGHALAAVGVCLPGLVVQDNYRMAFFANGHPEHATLIDFVKTVAQFAFLGLLLAFGLHDVGLLTLSWGLAATLSAVVAGVLLKARPRPGQARRWLRDQGSLTKYLLAEYSLGLGAAQLGALLVPVLGTTRDAGAIRGAQTLLGPLNVLGTAAFAFAVPEVSRRSEMGARHRVLMMAGLSGAMGLAALVYVVVVLVLPDSVGVVLFGDSWAGAQSVLLPMSLNALLAALGTGPGAMMLGMGLARKTFTFNLAKAPLLLGLLVPGTLLWGAQGAAWAMAITELVMLPFWVLLAARAVRGRYDHLIAALLPTPAAVDPGVEPVEPAAESNAAGPTR